MIGILIAKLQYLYRRPWTFIMMTVMSIIFALLLGSIDVSKVSVPAYAADEQLQQSAIIQSFEEETDFQMDWQANKADVDDKVKNMKAAFGIEIMEDYFTLVVGIDSPTVHIVEQTLSRIYKQAAQSVQLEAMGKPDNITTLLNPGFTIEKSSFQGEQDFIYDNRLHRLFGFALFFVIYTIAASVMHILIEKRTGVWDRMILSSVRKWEMYVANFIYSFLIGYFQVLVVFFIFRYVVQVDFYGAFFKTLIVIIPYVLAIVSLAIFITGIVKTVQQFNVLIPIVSVSMAMIGGAYWPLEIVQSNIMRALADFVPMTYGIDVLQGVTLYNYSFEEILLPVAVLLLMSVILTGLGIHMMEKRYVK